jgi:hypothetical protein
MTTTTTTTTSSSSSTKPTSAGDRARPHSPARRPSVLAATIAEDVDEVFTARLDGGDCGAIKVVESHLEHLAIVLDMLRKTQSHIPPKKLEKGAEVRRGEERWRYLTPMIAPPTAGWSSTHRTATFAMEAPCFFATVSSTWSSCWKRDHPPHAWIQGRYFRRDTLLRAMVPPEVTPPSAVLRDGSGFPSQDSERNPPYSCTVTISVRREERARRALTRRVP